MMKTSQGQEKIAGQDGTSLRMRKLKRSHGAEVLGCTGLEDFLGNDGQGSKK
jgi:hypothetical protein